MNKRTLFGRAKFLLLGCGLVFGLAACSDKKPAAPVTGNGVTTVVEETDEQIAQRDSLVSGTLENTDAASPASYPGGEEAMKAAIIKNIVFSDAEKAKQYKGEIPVRFHINADGSLAEFTLMNTINGECDRALVKAFGKLRGTKFNAAKDKDGKPVSVWLTINITFPIQK